MTEEHKLKIDFAYYMAIANSHIYPEEIMKKAQDKAIMIGIQLGLPIPSKAQQSEVTADTVDLPRTGIDDPFDLSGTVDLSRTDIDDPFDLSGPVTR